MSNVAELERQHSHALDKADVILASAQRANRALTSWERQEVDSCMTAVARLKPEISRLKTAQRRTTASADPSALRRQIDDIKAKTPAAWNVSSEPAFVGNTPGEPVMPKVLSRQYALDFADYARSGGNRITASLQESVGAAGGYAVPITVDNQTVPLAPTDCALRRLAQVRDTDRDILIPVFSAFGSASLTTEASPFAANLPTYGQTKLSAFMVDNSYTLSYELVQDRPEVLNELAESDASPDLLMAEEALFINGSGSGEPQGLIGNVGSGTTGEPDVNGNLVTLAGIDSLIGSLKAVYLSNATFLMSRATGIIVRAAQLLGSSGTTAFDKAWTRENGKDYLRGFSVEFSDEMPAAARGAAPVLFGDFKRGYIIGDRGGSAMRVKVLDQPLALNGLVQLLTFRRTDGRVRRSEAIQQYNVASS